MHFVWHGLSKTFCYGHCLGHGWRLAICGSQFGGFDQAYVVEDFFFDHSHQAWLALGWAVIVLSIIAITLMMILIREGAVSKVSSLIFLVPAVAALMTYLLFDETLNLVQILGMVVCAAAVLVVNRAANALSTIGPA